jgi:dCMP deaminase
VTTNWDYRWMNVAKHFGGWSKDPSTHVGAVIVRDDILLSQGWNGFPRGVSDDHRLHDREVKYALTVHAEMNAILNAGYVGVSLRGATLYVSGLPVCSDCAKGIIQTGIVRVISSFPEPVPGKWLEMGKTTAALLNEAEVKYERLNAYGVIVKFPW